MRKAVLVSIMALFLSINTGLAKAYNPLPACANTALISAIVNAQEAQGFALQNINYQPINYLLQPEPPYLAGTISMIFVPDCDPGEPCPLIAKLVLLNVTVVNNNGTCIISKAN